MPEVAPYSLIQEDSISAASSELLSPFSIDPNRYLTVCTGVCWNISRREPNAQNEEDQQKPTTAISAMTVRDIFIDFYFIFSIFRMLPIVSSISMQCRKSEKAVAMRGKSRLCGKR
jgi:hypothetical protein